MNGIVKSRGKAESLSRRPCSPNKFELGKRQTDENELITEWDL